MNIFSTNESNEYFCAIKKDFIDNSVYNSLFTHNSFAIKQNCLSKSERIIKESKTGSWLKM